MRTTLQLKAHNQDVEDRIKYAQKMRDVALREQSQDYLVQDAKGRCVGCMTLEKVAALGFGYKAYPLGAS